MKGIKKVVESVSILVMTGMLAITAVVTPEKIMQQQEEQGEETTERAIAGVTSVIAALDTEAEETVSIEKEAVDVVANPMQDETLGAKPAEPVAEEKKLTPEEKEWQKYLMADVEDFLYVREKKNEDSAIVGKLRKGDRALIKKAGKKWTKIESGSVVGFVMNKYCVTGSDALAYAKKNCEKIATVTGKVLRIRKEPSTDGKIVSALRKGETITVDTKTKTDKDWVAVKLGSVTCYVSADFVEVSLKTGMAVSPEEEKKAAEQEQAAKEAKKQEAKKQTQTAKTEKKQGEAVAASVDEETLLAALIQCEAGGEPYEAQLAVGAVVLNRMKSGRFPSKMKDVIYQRGQFGPARNGSLARALRNGPASTPRRAAKEALSGVDNTGGCLFFNNRSCGHSGLVIDRIVFW